MKRGASLLAAGLALLLVAATDRDAVDRVVVALRSATHGPAARRQAALVLAAAGAHPVDGTADVAARLAGPNIAAYRNRALGPAYRLIELGGGEAAHFEQTFLAGQRAHAAISGSPDAGFQLAIQDDAGAVQCAAAPRDCSWLPLWTARYSIDVRNRAPARGKAYLVIQ